MSWIVQQYEGEVHVVPDVDQEPHVLTVDCWCAPVRDDLEPGKVLHRDRLDREVG